MTVCLQQFGYCGTNLLFRTVIVKIKLPVPTKAELDTIATENSKQWKVPLPQFGFCIVKKNEDRSVQYLKVQQTRKRRVEYIRTYVFAKFYWSLSMDF